MSLTPSIDSKDWATILVTLLSPLVAVQVTKWLDRRQQGRDEQLRVFKTLMATRASTLDPRHVEALNMIDVVFHGTSKSEIRVRRQWKQYLDHLNDQTYPRDSWGNRRVELLVELLHTMATVLRFDFDKTDIKNQAYYPVGYDDIESDQAVIRKALAGLLSGERVLPIGIVTLPQDNARQPGSDMVEKTVTMRMPD